MSETHPILTPAALAEIYAHAKRDYPKECCGIAFGPRAEAVADRVKVCRNIQDELHALDPALHTRDAGTAYNFDASDMFLLNKSLRGDAPAKIIYHSHVEVGAYFSPTDQAAARMDDEPTYPVEYVVVDLRKDGVRGAVQFAWSAEQKTYLEVLRYE